MIHIGLFGLGNVGRAVCDILRENFAIIGRRTGQEISVKTVVVRDVNKYKDIKNEVIVTNDPEKVLADKDIDIVVEVMGGEYPAYDFICKAIKAGKHVVTANKEVVSKHKAEFFSLAQKHKVNFYYEAAVGGGIPLIRSLKVGFSANHIQAMYGILNGTTNYILSRIESEQKEFSEVLKKAQELGFAEADPAMDISGLDAAYKLDILAAVAFKANINVDQIYYEGIEAVTLKDISYAKELGYKIKLLAIGKEVEEGRLSLKVHPTMIPSKHLLASVNDEFNALFIVGDAVGEAMLSGKGAGGHPTGSAVVSDVVDIVFKDKKRIRDLDHKFEKVELVAIEDTWTQFYLRILLEDKPGALEKISSILSSFNVSIAKILQKDTVDGLAEVVLITHIIQEKQMQLALKSVKSLESVNKLATVIRVGLEENKPK